MIFQTLDDKADCVGIYTNNQLIFDTLEFPKGLTATWKYVPYLRGMEIDYATLYLEGRPILSSIPEYLQDDWDDISKKIIAFKRSLAISHVDTLENCFFDLVPSRFLVEFCEVKNKITKHILDSIKKPSRYEFYKYVSMMLTDISHRTVRLDRRKINTYKQVPKLKSHAETLLTCNPVVDYNQFGTKTGRLTTRKSTFPILTLNKVFRSSVLPQNDFFVELDFNGAEVRTLLGLLGADQPAEDVHEFHLNNIFTGLSTRDEAKVAFFAWLYGSRAAAKTPEATALEGFYDKSSLLDVHWKDKTVTTPFRKQIHDVEKHYALNYLVQSTAAELTLKQALKLDHLLRTQGSGSAIAFIIHDAVILDMKKEDEHLLKMLYELMKSTNFGTFSINIKKGQTLGSLRKEEIG
mgnify:FL=1